MPAVTDPKNKEKQVAKLLQELDELLGDGGLKTMLSRLKACEDVIGPIKDIDLKATFDEFERVKAKTATLTDQIRRSTKGLHVSGLEDYTQQFSMVRAMVGKRIGWKEAGAQFEHEVLTQATAKAVEMYSKAGIQMGEDKVAGSFIPDQVIPDVIGAIYTKSVFINLAGEGDTSRVSLLEGLVGGNVTIPKFDGGLIAYWIGEEDQYVESLVNTDDVTMNPKKLGILVKITEEMRRFAGFGFEALLRTDMIRAAAKKLDHTIAFGTGTNKMPRGILNTNGIKVYSAQSGNYGVLGTDDLGGALFQADWAGADLNFDSLNDVHLALEEDDIDLDDTFVTIGSPRYFTRLKQIKVDSYTGQTTNQAYLIGIPIVPDSRLTELIGPFAKSTQFANHIPGATVGAPTTEDELKFNTVIAGNLGTVVLGRWAGIEIDDDAGKGMGFGTDAIFMKLRLFADLAIRQPRAIIVVPDVRVLD